MMTFQFGDDGVAHDRRRHAEALPFTGQMVSIPPGSPLQNLTLDVSQAMGMLNSVPQGLQGVVDRGMAIQVRNGAEIVPEGWWSDLEHWPPVLLDRVDRFRLGRRQ